MPTRILITAGPTHEPIDAVRYLGNRSSGRLGIALAEAAAAAECDTTLLLGPAALIPNNSRILLRRFRTAADLQAALAESVPGCDILIMAAAVADFRPAPPAAEGADSGKIRRTDAGLTLHLEPVPDLLAEASQRRRPDQTFIGFALEPRAGLLDAARAKLARKGVDAIVANPLETMDAPTIEGALVTPEGHEDAASGALAKEEFAKWLIARVLDLHARNQIHAEVRS